MKSREGGGKRKYDWGWLRKECSECTPPTSPKSLMFTVSGFLTNYFFFPFKIPPLLSILWSSFFLNCSNDLYIVLSFASFCPLELILDL